VPRRQDPPESGRWPAIIACFEPDFRMRRVEAVQGGASLRESPRYPRLPRSPEQEVSRCLDSRGHEGDFDSISTTCRQAASRPPSWPSILHQHPSARDGASVFLEGREWCGNGAGVSWRFSWNAVQRRPVLPALERMASEGGDQNGRIVVKLVAIGQTNAQGRIAAAWTHFSIGQGEGKLRVLPQKTPAPSPGRHPRHHLTWSSLPFFRLAVELDAAPEALRLRRPRRAASPPLWPSGSVGQGLAQMEERR
jgi:hypothetical protein